MTKKKILRYTISRPGYERVEKNVWGTSYSNFETAKTIEQARKKARLMGDGAEIEQLSITRSGKYKVKSWIYGGN